MKKSVICFALIFFSFNACKKDEQNNLPPAIKALIAENPTCECNPFIDEYKWRNKTVYLYSCGGPACDCTVLYYDENGQSIKMDSGYTIFNFQDSAQLVKHVWSCHN